MKKTIAILFFSSLYLSIQAQTNAEINTKLDHVIEKVDNIEKIIKKEKEGEVDTLGYFFLKTLRLKVYDSSGNRVQKNPKDKRNLSDEAKYKSILVEKVRISFKNNKIEIISIFYSDETINNNIASQKLVKDPVDFNALLEFNINGANEKVRLNEMINYSIFIDAITKMQEGVIILSGQKNKIALTQRKAE